MVSFYSVDPMQKPNNYCTYCMRALQWNLQYINLWKLRKILCIFVCFQSTKREVSYIHVQVYHTELQDWLYVDRVFFFVFTQWKCELEDFAFTQTYIYKVNRFSFSQRRSLTSTIQYSSAELRTSSVQQSRRIMFNQRFCGFTTISFPLTY